jgi:hypothetical protein
MLTLNKKLFKKDGLTIFVVYPLPKYEVITNPTLYICIFLYFMP